MEVAQGEIVLSNSSMCGCRWFYKGSVLPAFIMEVVGANFENWVRKYVPEVLSLMYLSFITLFVMSIFRTICIRPNLPSNEKK